jgi:hypothetical protein
MDTKNRRRLESVKPGAAHCRSVTLRQRVYRLADGHQPLVGFAALVARSIITAKSGWQQARNVVVRT